MELIVLGSAGAWPGPGQAASGYLVREDGFNLVLDLGTGALSNLQRHVPHQDVDAIVLSHEHLVYRRLPFANRNPQVERSMSLGIQVDDTDAMARFSQSSAQVDGCGCLSHTALLIHHRN